VKIRSEEEKDWAAVYSLNKLSFDSASEANLVELLRTHVSTAISLVAEDDQEVVGHIMFTPVSLSGFPEASIMGLAPMAVSSQKRSCGIGSALVRKGLEECRELGVGAVVVLGHSEYYPRFGFKPASLFGVQCEYDVPEEVFMAIEIQSGYLLEKNGVVKYHELFAGV
jgi:putative acetyltransferase